MSDPKLKFNEVLKTLMEKHELTQKQLSSMVGIPESNLSTYLSGSFPQDPLVIYKCARVFSVSYFYILFGEEELTEEQQKIKQQVGELTAGKFELILRPIKE
ncbi:MAG: helix-turn-helix transcriptional regulator [Oligoflexia bacterium]|nr:helix-turn-helix transcriptional regulator [Oligoflexia bacterium]